LIYFQGTISLRIYPEWSKPALKVIPLKSLSPLDQEEFNKNRNELLHQLDETLNLPMAILGIVWLGLLVVDLVWGLNPTLETLLGTIWIIFITDFLLKFFLAPEKGLS